MSYDAECYCATNDGDQCVFCEMETRERLRTVGNNLRVAGALCQSFESGIEQERMMWDATIDRITPEDLRAQWWRPGCGRSAP